MNRATVFDCFCGLGGLSVGAELACLDVVGGVDADETAVAAYARIFPGNGRSTTTSSKRILVLCSATPASSVVTWIF